MAPTVKTEWGLGLYFSLLSAQTVGTAVLLSNMIPLYRLMAMDFANYIPDARPWWAIAGILLIQGAYWLRMHLQLPLPRTRNTLLGHILAFATKLTFVAVTASFSVMFINRFQALKEMNYPPLRALGVLIMFFSLFCWTLDLERLAKVLQEEKHGTGETHQD